MSAERSRQIFADELSRVTRKWRTLVDADLRGMGMTLSRARAILHLCGHDGITQRELAAELDIETATLVRLLDGLAEQGLIERRASAMDRRANTIHLTPAARRLARDVRARIDAIRDDVLAGVSARDLDTAASVLGRIAAALEERG
ncbi:MarR family winged helix-turn-helix transcriptional regulator [Microvirga pudoricolor]|uniref:MarR family winged helix-turn-helix transcriptional regulator n=1 Tax=Microvirga pudoricolor TaxID=2778729 RepID=UPI001951B8C2|nr:MarR family transcriptional regulator [Microvirga pudoricolor]MBM6596630.1 MarR family transcriptional regulator [Microvirga pudoricolor]